MGKVVSSIFGGGDASREARKAAQAQSRRALAEMARAAAEADRGKASGGRKRGGRSILTYLGADGQGTLG
jgi:hypothetical protein